MHMFFLPAKLPFKVFSILFKVHWAYCVYCQKVWKSISYCIRCMRNCLVTSVGNWLQLRLWKDILTHNILPMIRKNSNVMFVAKVLWWWLIWTIIKTFIQGRNPTSVNIVQWALQVEEHMECMKENILVIDEIIRRKKDLRKLSHKINFKMLAKDDRLWDQNIFSQNISQKFWSSS